MSGKMMMRKTHMVLGRLRTSDESVWMQSIRQ